MRINYVNEIENALRRINRVLNKDLKKEMMKLDLSLSHFYILTTLYKEEKMSSGDVAESLGVANATITSLVDKFVKLSYVKRRRDKKDRRVVLVELTEKGKEVAEKLLSLRRKRLAEILKRLPEESVKEIYEAINRVKEMLTEND